MLTSNMEHTFIFFTVLLYGVSAFYGADKESFLARDILRDLVSRMGKEDLFDQSQVFLDYQPVESRYSPMTDTRSLAKALDEEEEEQLFPLDYDSFGSDININPSLRDQEFLEHSTLWGSQLMSGGAGEGKQRLKPDAIYKNHMEVKSDTTLPAYCNPPNPCPLEYTSEQGCLEEFENTASFSRRYQASQNCMCDSEHMFYCPDMVSRENNLETAMDDLNNLDFNNFLRQVDPMFQHKNLAAKKFHAKKSYRENPFLTGEKLPVAAKKGNNVIF
nr:uncharacterized protein LOC111414271 [Onthophagus taurus]